MKTLEELAAEYAAAQSQRKSAEADLAVAARRMRSRTALPSSAARE